MMKKLLRNNKGLSLIELLVAFALLTVVSAAVLGLLTVGANSFRRVNSEVSLQYEAQLTMKQLQEYLVDCNRGLFWDSSTRELFIANADDENNVTIHRFGLVDGQIYYSSGEATRSGSTGSCTFGEQNLLSTYTTEFNIFPASRRDLLGRLLCESCQVTLSLSMTDRSYKTEELVAMRNPVLLNQANYQSWLNLITAE